MYFPEVYEPSYNSDRVVVLQVLNLANVKFRATVSIHVITGSVSECEIRNEISQLSSMSRRKHRVVFQDNATIIRGMYAAEDVNIFHVEILHTLIV